ncbi:MAG: tetratricopeptide repeat protein [Planctomycetota bacterium]
MSASPSPGGYMAAAGRTFYGLVAGVVLLALGVRLLYLTQIERIPFFYHLIGDGAAYWAWAGRIAGGDWFGTGTFYQAPAYPYFLAVVRLVLGDDLWRAHLVQAALGSIACGLLALAGRAFISPWAGLCTGILMALYGPAIFFDGLIQKATLTLFLMALLLCLLAWLTQRGWNQADDSGRGTEILPGVIAFVVGVVLGLLALTHEQTLVLGVVVLVWVASIRACGESGQERCGTGILPVKTQAGSLCYNFCHGEPSPPTAGAGMSSATQGKRGPPVTLRRAILPGLLVTGTALVLGLVGWRNYRVGGEIALTTFQAGPNFYIGNHQGATGRYIALRPGAEWPPLERQAATELAEAEVGRALTPREVSRYWFAKAWDYIRHHPLDWLRLLLYKWVLVWNAYELSDTESFTLYAHLSWLLGVLGKLNHFGVLGPLAAVGLAATARRWRNLWTLYAMIVVLAGGVALFYVFARYRYPLVPLLAIFAGAGVVEIVRTMRRLAGRRSETGAEPAGYPLRPWMMALLAGAVAVGSNLRFDHQHLLDGTAYENWGVVLAEDGNNAAAAYLLAEALRYRPESPEIHTHLGAALAAQDRIDEALHHLGEALRLDPDFPRAHFQVGLLYARLGRFDEAIQAYREALRTEPANAAAHYNIGAILDHQGRVEEAIAEYHQALAIDPNHAKTRQALQRSEPPRSEPRP